MFFSSLVVTRILIIEVSSRMVVVITVATILIVFFWLSLVRLCVCLHAHESNS